MHAGYFTSRPTSKGWIREATSYLQAARVLHLMTLGSNATGGLTPDRLESELGVLQHHDSITGTEKQAVNGDYRIRLTRGTAVLWNNPIAYLLRPPASPGLPWCHC